MRFLVCECFVSTEEQKNIFEFGRFSYEAYVLVSGLFFYFGFWPLAVGFWLLALLYVMLNLVQHLTASLFLHFLRGQILKRVQDDIML